MTREEFIRLHKAAIQQSERHTTKVVVCGLVLIVAVAIVGRLLVSHLDQIEHFDVPVRLAADLAIGFFGFAMAAIAFGKFKLKQIHGVPCPCCNKLLTNESARLVKLVGNCSFCGERVTETSSQ